jgi:hypothetical protein
MEMKGHGYWYLKQGHELTIWKLKVNGLINMNKYNIHDEEKEACRGEREMEKNEMEK